MLMSGAGCSAGSEAEYPELSAIQVDQLQQATVGGPVIDTDGTPDLVVRKDMLTSKWVIRNEAFSDTDCAAIEGHITSGVHRLVRFSVGTANIGDADLVVGDPQKHYDANDGLFEMSTCHGHFHFRHYAKYELVDPVSGKSWRAAKQGFCMIDTDRNPPSLGKPDRPAIFTSCGRPALPGLPAIPGNQGISHGWTDTYGYQLQGQFFILDGGDGQDPVPPGTYTLRITVNPPFTPAPGDPPCPNWDSKGFCHQLPESNYDNNITEHTVAVP
jgi:hypothetical protein